MLQSFRENKKFFFDTQQNMGKSSVEYSVIVPAYKEQGNLRSLVERVFAAVKAERKSDLSASSVEILIVDDNSRDGSVETVEQLQKDGYNARIIVRTKERGLSSAVVRGFEEAKGEMMLCMDADLQVSPRYSFSQRA